jgi:hypothetical protein
MKTLQTVFAGIFFMFLLVAGTGPVLVQDCVSTYTSQVCVGETADSVFSKLDNTLMVNQRIERGDYGIVTYKTYDLSGNRFTLTISRPSYNGPYRVTKITR